MARVWDASRSVPTECGGVLQVAGGFMRGMPRVRDACVRWVYARDRPRCVGCAGGDVLRAVRWPRLLRVVSFAVEDPDALTDLHLGRCLYDCELVEGCVPCVCLYEVAEVYGGDLRDGA